MKSVAEIAALFLERKQERGPFLGRAKEIKDAYNGDLVVSLPERHKNERVAVANLLAQGIDAHGQRIASTQPEAFAPPLRPGFKASEETARSRRKAWLGWWEMNSIELSDYYRARWLITYASTPVIIRPDFKRGIPAWDICNPLDAFPSASASPVSMEPDDCILAWSYPAATVKRRWPQAAAVIDAASAADWRTGTKSNDKIEVVEYVDEHEHVLLAVGTANAQMRGGSGLASIINVAGRSHWAAELSRTANRAGVCTAVVPGRITLDRPKGQFDDVVGLFWQQAQLMALEVNAVTESVYPATWFVEQQGGSIITVADGPSGVVGHVRGGDIKTLQNNPGFQTYPTIDRLERAQRQAGGIPAEMGGEATSGIRTGRRGEQVLGAAIDFPIQESHKLLARSKQFELERAMAVAVGYFRNAKKSFHVSWKGASGPSDYMPVEVFETGAAVRVTYALAGADQNGLTIRAGQLLGTGQISQQLAREMNPEIPDAELEKDRVLAEGIMAALLQSIQTQAADPAGPYQPADMARLADLIVTNKMELPEAVMLVQKEAQERQAAAATPAPDALADPAMQPGLGTPGAPGTVPTPLPEEGPSEGRLAQLLGNLRLPQMTSAAERAPV